MDDYYIDCRGLKVHVVAWGKADRPAVLLHHGFMDHARSWDPVAEALADTYRVLAIDARGHGDSQWIHGGGYYYFQDYVFDILDIIDNLAAGRMVFLVGHSMGGMACSLFAGTFPDRVKALVSIEGGGPPNFKPGVAPALMAQWIFGVREAKAKPLAGEMADLGAAAAKLRAYNPRLSADFSIHLAEHGTRRTGQGEKVIWKFDPIHRTRSPQPFYVEQARAFWQRISAPALLVQGELSPFKWQEEENRENIPGAKRIVIPGAGHMVHHEQPQALAAALKKFLGESA